MIAALFLFGSLVGCTPAPEATVENQIVNVGCGTCIYRLPDGVGCYWAIELDGEHYPVAGTLPKDHDNHGPEGMCNMERQARVTGELRRENFLASAFELLPPEKVPAKPKYTHEDEHGKDYRATP